MFAPAPAYCWGIQSQWYEILILCSRWCHTWLTQPRDDDHDDDDYHDDTANIFDYSHPVDNNESDHGHAFIVELIKKNFLIIFF